MKTGIYEYPCSLCKVEYKWSVEEPKHGITCPSCRKSIMDEMIAWGEAQQKDELRLKKQMNEWWDYLPEDVKEKAFFCVVNKLVQSELIEKKTYRQILQDEFGFGPDSYYMGITCGFMSLHNAIIPQNEQSEMREALREKKNKDKIMKERFTIKSTCDSCGYQSMDLYPKSVCPMIDCEGMMK